jgi:hypothetical protein
MSLKTHNNESKDYIEVLSISSIYSEPNPQGKQRLIKAGILTKLSVYVDDIQAHEETFDDRGKVRKNMCKIYHRQIGPIVIKESYDNISKLKQSKIIHTTAGFK